MTLVEGILQLLECRQNVEAADVALTPQPPAALVKKLAAGQATRALEDKVYEIEDDLRLASQGA